MSVGELSGYLKRHLPKIREELLQGEYKPLPVKRKEIPKTDIQVLEWLDYKAPEMHHCLETMEKSQNKGPKPA